MGQLTGRVNRPFKQQASQNVTTWLFSVNGSSKTNNR